MNIQQNAIITLIKSAITGEKCKLPEGFDLIQAKTIAQRHNIVSMIYYGALNCGIPPKDATMQALFVKTCMYIAVSERQALEVKKILPLFEKNEIKHMPLKGLILKSMYPKSEMRVMGDADILICTEQIDRINSVMQELGYDFVGTSDHEIKWKTDNLFVELHSRLIPSYNKDYYSYFGDGWRLAKVNDGGCYRYAMTDEDMLIYLFVHFAKHYRDAGIGIKHMVDLWVYTSQKNNMNEEYIETELKKLQLNDFYQNIMHTLNVWFADAQTNAKTDFITNIIFNSGVFGTNESQILSDALKTSKTVGSAKKVRVKKFFDLVFLPYKSMRVKYPLLNKAPYLLPAMWIYRVLDILIHKRERIKFQNNKVRMMTQDNIDNYQVALNFVGLDFNFKE